MRAEMAKVIVERPRRGSCLHGKPKGYRKLLRLQLEKGEGGPIQEGMKRRCRGGTKFLNEHLGPLRRYLDSQVGRPWDKVFSEICAHLNRNSAVQDHVRDHVEDYVATHVLLIDGVPCSVGGRIHGEPLRALRNHGWYVCPRTGLLKRVPAMSRKRLRRPQPEKPPRYVPVGDTMQCRFIDGAWHVVTLKPLPAPGFQRERSTAIDILLKVPIISLTPIDARRHYGAEVYALSSRRLALKELRQYPIPMQWWQSVATG
jgi:hypothetical protein